MVNLYWDVHLQVNMANFIAERVLEPFSFGSSIMNTMSVIPDKT